MQLSVGISLQISQIRSNLMSYKFLLFGCLVTSASSIYAQSATGDSPSPAIEFNSQMLMGNARTQDLSRFSRGNPIIPGTQRYDVYVNDLWIGRRDVEIVVGKSIYIGKICLNKSLAGALNIDAEKLAPQRREILKNISLNPKAAGCVSLEEIVDDSFVKIDPDSLKLSMSIPQLYSKASARGSVPREIWDDGISAGVLNYSIQSYESEFSGKTNSSTLGLYDVGASIGGWRYRQSGSAIYQSTLLSATNVSSSYVYTDLPDLNGKFLFGSTGTNSLLFPSVKLLGAQLFSDDRMLPYSQQGYAPVVRGIARSNARVLITERGIPVYQTTVSPGPFEIADLPSGGYGGNLLVTVTEADGTESQFNVLYSATPQLLRSKAMRYDFAIGTYDGSDKKHMVSLLQSGLSYGLSDNLTLNGGTSLAEGYTSAALGASFGSQIGSFSIDLIGSDFSFKNKPRQLGESIKFGYAATIPKLETNFAVAAYQNTSSNFVPFDQAVSILNGTALPVSSLGQREQLVLSLSQSLGKFGSFYGTASQTNYWNDQPDQTQFQLGFSRGIGKAFVSVNLSRQITNEKSIDRLAANLVLPLGTGSQRVLASAGVQSTSNGMTQSNIGVSGALSEDGLARYNANVSDNGVGQTAAGLSGSVSTSVGILDGSTSNSNNTSNRSIGFRGSLIAHAGGLIASPPTGETITIVHAPGAAGARIGTYGSSKINEKGYGVHPYASPYSVNNVELDLAGLPLDVSITNTSQISVPKSGAVTFLKFESELSKFVVTQIENAKELGLTYGAEIYDENKNIVGTIGQGNKAQFHVSNLDQRIFVRSPGLNGQEYLIQLNKRDETKTSTMLTSAIAKPVGQIVQSLGSKTIENSDGSGPKSRSEGSLNDRKSSSTDSGVQPPPVNKLKRVSGLVRRQNGLPIPDGANVVSSNESSEHMSNVSSSGLFVTRVKEGTRMLRMMWGDNSSEVCLIDIQNKKSSTDIFECI